MSTSASSSESGHRRSSRDRSSAGVHRQAYYLASMGDRRDGAHATQRTRCQYKCSSIKQDRPQTGRGRRCGVNIPGEESPSQGRPACWRSTIVIAIEQGVRRLLQRSRGIQKSLNDPLDLKRRPVQTTPPARSTPSTRSIIPISRPTRGVASRAAVVTKLLIARPNSGPQLNDVCHGCQFGRAPTAPVEARAIHPHL